MNENKKLQEETRFEGIVTPSFLTLTVLCGGLTVYIIRETHTVEGK